MSRRDTPRSVTGAELHKATRQQRGDVPRHHLRRPVRAAAAEANSEHDFLNELRANGLLVRPRAGTANTASPADTQSRSPATTPPPGT